MTARRFIWVTEAVILAVHDAQLAEHGGQTGVRDAGLLSSALARPLNLVAYGKPDLAACAAAYGYGLIRNHPFLDGNKRTGFVTVELFLALNDHLLGASDTDCVLTVLALADGTLKEEGFAEWIRKNLEKSDD